MSLCIQQRAIDRLEKMGTLEFDTSRKGRPRTVPRDAVDHIIWLIQQDPAKCLVAIKEHLFHNGIQSSLPTISRTLERGGFTYKRIKKRALERSPYARTEFIHRMAGYRVDQLIWLDESAKDERTCTRSYGWGVRGQDAVIDAPFLRGMRSIQTFQSQDQSAAPNDLEQGTLSYPA
jgi:transposase